jgi:hypothetical protein|tara:strand:+ start:1111 stop:1263 length:153 start_codon:yes stop_codon:yes gene_type:complete
MNDLIQDADQLSIELANAKSRPKGEFNRFQAFCLGICIGFFASAFIFAMG